MFDSFKIGEIAILRRTVSYPSLVGQQCRILSKVDTFFVNDFGWATGHLVEIPGAPRHGFPARVPEFNGWIVHPTQLRKLSSSHEAARWSDCCWQPDSLSMGGQHD